MGIRSPFRHVQCPSGLEYDLPLTREAAAKVYRHYRKDGKSVQVEIRRSGAFIIHGAA